jgi:hypothetical protein
MNRSGGKRGTELPSNVTDSDAAKMQTAHGVIQRYNAQALVDAKHQVIVHAAAIGNRKDYGHVAPMLDRAKASVQAVSLPEAYFAGKPFSADSNTHSEGSWRRVRKSSSMPTFLTPIVGHVVRALPPKNNTSLHRKRNLLSPISPTTQRALLRAPMANCASWKHVGTRLRTISTAEMKQPK